MTFVEVFQKHLYNKASKFALTHKICEIELDRIEIIKEGEPKWIDIVDYQLTYFLTYESVLGFEFKGWNHNGFFDRITFFITDILESMKEEEG